MRLLASFDVISKIGMWNGVYSELVGFGDNTLF
jgi:hypothetical protein